MCSVHIPAYGVQFLVSNMQKNILKYVSFKLAAFQRMTQAWLVQHPTMPVFTAGSTQTTEGTWLNQKTFIGMMML